MTEAQSHQFFVPTQKRSLIWINELSFLVFRKHLNMHASYQTTKGDNDAPTKWQSLQDLLLLYNLLLNDWALSSSHKLAKSLLNSILALPRAPNLMRRTLNNIPSDELSGKVR